MNDDFWNTVKGVVANMLAQQGQSRMGVVSSVDPARGVAKVVWDEEGTTSGWLPIAQQAVGNGWGVVTLPKPGTQVFVAPDMGAMDHGVILGSVHSTQQPIGRITPYKATDAIPLVPGEPTMISESGASIRLTGGSVIEMRGTVKVDGDLLVRGQVSDLDGVHGTVDTLRQVHNTHDHMQSVGLPTKVTP